nr:glycosyltransferase [Synechococcus sp. GFB01]
MPGLQESELIHSLDPQALRTRRPWLVSIHDVAWRHFGPDYAAVFNRAMQRSAERCIATATHLLAVSRCTADELIAGGVAPSRITVIHQGVELEPALAPGLPSTLPADLPPRYVLYVGTFQPRKNLPLIARVYARPGAEALPPCLIAGPPPDQPLERFGIDGRRIRYLATCRMPTWPGCSAAPWLCSSPPCTRVSGGPWWRPWRGAFPCSPPASRPSWRWPTTPPSSSTCTIRRRPPPSCTTCSAGWSERPGWRMICAPAACAGPGAFAGPTRSSSCGLSTPD